MKKYIPFITIILVVFLIFSCQFDSGKIDTREEAELVSDIVFKASYAGIADGCSGTVTETHCVSSSLTEGGSIELCIGDEEVLSNSVFYSGLTIADGCVLSIAYNNAHVVYPANSDEYILDGSLSVFGSMVYQEISADIVAVFYGSIDVDGAGISDSADFDIKYTCTAVIAAGQLKMDGTIEGTVNGIDITDEAWDMIIPLY